MAEIGDDLAELLRKPFRESLAHLCIAGLGYKDLNPRTHGAVIDMLEDPDAKRKLICLPRGSLKSSIACVGYPIWRLLNEPNLRIMIDSEIYTNSCTFIREIKGHLQSRRMGSLFGDFRGPVWTESDIIVKQRTKVLKEPSISAAGIGTTRVGQHFDTIIMDDMNSPRNTGTPEQAEKVISHYRYNTSILEPGGTMIVIGTRYSASDLIGHILENEHKQKGLFNGN